jgi:hypothetical protein
VTEKERATPSQPAGGEPGGASGAAATGLPKDTSAPVLVDLGKKRRKQIKQLKRGKGPLVAEVADVIEQVRSELGNEVAGKTVLPVVLIYERKRRRRSFSSLPIFPC